ncbi:host cell division inhibitor Icd-like protein [Salmonella enterica]|uniref:host cell division inhibitor Icd-like protein n=1 Tax=Salmonella enterica TaxID=28901 RepID=UPI0034565E36
MKNHTTQQREQKNRLPVYVAGLYIPVAGVNPPAGFSSLTVNADNRDDSDMRFFYVRNTTHAPIMAGRSGGSVRARWFRLRQSANPRYALPPRLAARWQGSKKPVNEAVTMVNANPCPYPLFIWRFFSGQNSTYLTTTAASEREARLQLPAVHLVFVARIRLEGSYHA